MPDTYNEGMHTGQQDKRLDNAEDRLTRINGSIDDTRKALLRLELAVQQLRSDFTSAGATVLATALALKQAGDTARQAAETAKHAAENRWAPTMRILAVAAVITTVLGLVLAVALKK